MVKPIIKVRASRDTVGCIVVGKCLWALADVLRLMTPWFMRFVRHMVSCYKRSTMRQNRMKKC